MFAQHNASSHLFFLFFIIQPALDLSYDILIYPSRRRSNCPRLMCHMHHPVRLRFTTCLLLPRTSSALLLSSCSTFCSCQNMCHMMGWTKIGCKLGAAILWQCCCCFYKKKMTKSMAAAYTFCSRTNKTIAANLKER